MNVNQLQEQLDSDDTGVLEEAFAAMSVSTDSMGEARTMDRVTMEKLMPLCVGKLKHDDIAVRAGACRVIAEQLQAGSPNMTPYLAAVGQTLASVTNMDLSLGKENKKSYAMYHRHACDIITEMQYNKPALLMQSFRPLGQYLVSCTGNRNRSISTAACNYWARLLVPPVSAQLIEAWLPAVLNKLGKLVPALLKCMVYTEDHVRYLEGDHRGDDRGTEEDKLNKLEEYTNQRNFAALGFENVCCIFQNEVIIIFKPLIPKWLRSEDWMQAEAMLLALGAFTKAVGIPREMSDVYKDLIPHILEQYSHPKPLVRSITCFTMQQFINLNVKGVKDPFNKMIKCTLSLLQDQNQEVQEMALNSLSAMLAFANRDVTPFSKRLISELSDADASLKGAARFTYYECISHVFGRLAALLAPGDAEQLLAPLMAQWRTLQSNAAGDNVTDKEETFRLCQSLCVIATFAKSGFAPYNDEIFGKVVPYVSKIASSVSTHGEVSGEAVTGHLVAYLDVLSAIFEGQGKEANSMATKYRLVEVTVDLLENTKLQDRAHQSALALLGHICSQCFDTVMPSTDRIFDILRRELSKEVTGIRNNALWTLTPMISKYPSEDDNLLQFSSPLQKILMTQNLDQSTSINAAMALTSLAKRYPDEMAGVILKDEIFAVLCGLLHQQFPREIEKTTIFINLCFIVTPNVKQLSREACTQLCIAAAILDVHDQGLTRALTSVLRDVRSAVGNNGWNKLSQQIGNQLAYSLRKRYKLY